MKYIRKAWFRFLVSWFIGAAYAESHSNGITISEGVKVMSWGISIFVFILLTAIVYYDIYKHYYFPSKEDTIDSREDILDSNWN